MEKRAWKFKHIRPWIAYSLMIVGFLLALSPFFYHYYYFHENSRQTQEIEKKLDFLENKEEIEGHVIERLIADEGILEIPAISLKVKVVYGIEESDLEKGPGFYPQSQYPNYGNVSIAGHRNTAGSPFLNLDRLEAGDEIKLYYRGEIYNYNVEEIYETHSRDWSVIDQTPTPALTLTTCHPLIKPIGGDYHRLIVRAYLLK